MVDVSRLAVWSAEGYDSARPRLVPHLNAFYEVAVELAAAGERPAPRVLDLGAGTGLFACGLASVLPEATFDLVDSSEQMLAAARPALDLFAVGHTPHVRDLREALPPGPFDIVVSALAIHQLPRPDQRRLYGRVREVLAPGGVFVNAEQVAGPDPMLDALYGEVWLREAADRGASGAEIDAVREELVRGAPAPVADHLAWLAEAGFDGADCFYKRYGFAVLAGWG
ncbi:class I SAM-dependent methyltransferase [Streptomyces sp. NPDC050617]|uniref:class I SAM-dependent methyltransferase n=1 Tax=Streptomyces sp. NPDC050617 TaxID=3154628 RepID=UPI0034306FE2